MREVRWLDVIQSVAIVLTLLGSMYAMYLQREALASQREELEASNKIHSADLVLKISNRLNWPQYSAIIDAIENHNSHYSLLSHGITDPKIEDYIGNFETLGDLARDGLVSQSMVYDELSFDLEKAWCNVDVQRDIRRWRKEDGTHTGAEAFYSGFEKEATFSLNKDKKTCAQIDDELN